MGNELGGTEICAKCETEYAPNKDGNGEACPKCGEADYERTCPKCGAWEDAFGSIEDGEPGIGTLNWVIVGAESGGQRRLCKPEWVRSIVDQCREAEVPVFVKQLHIDGRLSKDMAEWPADLRVRELPIADLGVRIGD